ncbi:hypothetical protein T06_16794 [Trichinella sp. T6]|nr:hypothetical protein T06_16794 [Trichinella sp. T6]
MRLKTLSDYRLLLYELICETDSMISERLPAP